MQIYLVVNFWACVAVQEVFVSSLQGHSLKICWVCQSLETVSGLQDPVCTHVLPC